MPPPASRHPRPLGWFALRTPLLSFDVLERLSAHAARRGDDRTDDELDRAIAADRAETLSSLRTLATLPHVREALALTSPTFAEAVRAWLEDPASPRAHDVPASLLRYVSRMASRPTPHGLL